MIIRPLFEKYQKELLEFCNTKRGRRFLAGDLGGKIQDDDVVYKVTPDGFHILDKVENKQLHLRATFFPRSPYIGRFAEILTDLEIIKDDNFYRDVPIDELKNYIHLDTSTFNPNAHPEVTSVDGHAGRNPAGGENWATIRAGSGDDSGDTQGTNIRPIYLSESGGSFSVLYRAFFLFDSSGLTSDATITAGVNTCSFYHDTTAVSNAHTSSVALVDTTPASNTAIVNADYSQSGTTAQATAIALSSWVINSYNDYTLNATGDASISKTGVTKFGLRWEKDRANSDPAGDGDGDDHLTLRMADAGTNIPKLVVTYTLPAAGGGTPFTSY